MKRKSLQLIVLLLLAAVGLPLSTVRAQEVQVTVMPKMDPMPPQVMNYISQPGNYFNVTLNNTSTEALNVFLTLEVEQTINGELHISTPYYIQPNAPITLIPNSPTPVTNVALQSQFRQLETSDIVLTGGQLSDFYGTGIVGLLPEGTYKAYIRAYKWEPGVKYPQMVSNPMAGQCTFNVCYSAQSPEITVPFYQPTLRTQREQAQLETARLRMESAQSSYLRATGGAKKKAALSSFTKAKAEFEKLSGNNDEQWQAAVVDNAAATFAWTTPILNCGGIPKQYTYDLEFFPINSSMRTPEQAVNAQIKAYAIKGLTTPTCVLTPAQVTQIQQYGNTVYYVARVTARPRITNKNDINYSTIENDGHSQLQVFRFSDTTIVPAPGNDMADDDDESEGKDDSHEDVSLTPTISDDVDENADYIIFPPKLTSPDNSKRGVLEENAKVELEWEAPQVKTSPTNAKALEYTYNVLVYKKSALQGVDQALKGEPILKKESLSAKTYTIPWDDLKDKVKPNDNLVYAVTATITNEDSVGVDNDHRNIYQQAYADLSDKSAGMDDCYADAADDITNKELATFSEIELRNMEVSIGQFDMVLTNTNLNREKQCYTGKGYVKWYPFGKDGLPFKINVEFDSIKINSDKIVYAGNVKSCREEDEELSSYIPYDIFDDCCISDYLNSGSAEALGNKVDEYLQNNSSTAQYYKYAQSGAKFIDDIIKSQATVNLPVSLKKPLGDDGVTLDSSPIDIQILSANFSPTTAAVSVLGMLAMPNSSYIDSDVAIFGAPRICIEPESFVPEGVTIALLSDFTLRDPETDFVFNLRAPTDFVALDDGCSMTFSSNGLDSLSFEADMTVPGLLKADDKGNVIENEDPAVHIRAFIKDWDNWLGTIAMDNFQVEEAQGFTFEVGGSGISYDHSLTHNAKGFSLPKDDGAVKYDKAAAGCDKNVLHWQGLYINKLGVILPSFFDDDKGGNVEIAVKSLLYDDSGVSLQAAVQGSKSAPIVKAHTSKAGGWGISLESVNLNVISSNFASTSIIGGIQAPIIGGEWEYKTSFSMAEKKKSRGKALDILFTMDPREDPSFDFFLATLDLNKEYTHFKVHNFEEETDVEMQMAGKITIEGLEEASKKVPLDFSISGVEFTGMRLANFAPEKRSEQSAAAEKKFSYTFDPICEGEKKGDLWFDLGTWSLASPGKQLGPFNFTLDNFGIASKTKEGKQLTGVNIEGTVSLIGESGTFAATAGLTVWAKLDIEDIKNIDVDYEETTLDKIAINSEFGGCKVAGSLEFAETDKKKGYAGSLEFTLPGELFTMKAAGGFFKCKDDEGDYMSAYFIGEIGSATGIPMGVIQLNSICGGFFFNTSLSDTEKESPLEWKKTETRGIHGGMFGLGISTVGSDRGVNAKVKMIVVYDANKNRLSTFRMTGKIHALCVSPQAEDGLINADCSIVYQNLSSKEGGKFFQINITVDASGDMDQMVEQFTGQKFEMPDITAGLEEMEDKSDKKSKDAKDSKPKVTCGFHISLDFKVTMRADDEPKSTKTKWHLWIGQPGDGSYESEMKNRCSITLIDFQVGGKNDPVAAWGKIWANAYLCIGNELPNDGELPPIPDEIQEFLDGDDANGNKQNLSSTAQTSRESAKASFSRPSIGSGVMFGAQAGGEFGVNAVVCYAEASLMAGFDIVLGQLPQGSTCNGQPAGGKGGFYGMGQVYALAKGEMGLMINLWIFEGKWSLIDVGLGALLKGGFPNPSWVYGKVRAKCKLFGGLIKFNGSLTLKAGDVCFPDMGNPLDNIQIFGDVAPGQDTKKAGWTGKDDDRISCYTTLGFTTNMAIGQRLDLVDQNVSNRMAGMDGDPERYTGNAARAYKFYLDEKANLYSWSDNASTNEVDGDITGATLTGCDFTSSDKENFKIVVPRGKLNPTSKYMMRLTGYCKEIVNGKEVWPVFNDSTSGYKDYHKEWRDTAIVYFQTDKLPNDISQDAGLTLPSSGGNDYHLYGNELKRPEIHLRSSRIDDGDNIFNPYQYDIRARVEKKEHGIWVPADAKINQRASGHYVDENGDIDWFTTLNEDGTVADTQSDPFSEFTHVQWQDSKGNGKNIYEKVIHTNGLAQERLLRFIKTLDAMMSNTQSVFGSSPLYQKYATLKWVPETYNSLTIATNYYLKLLEEDKKSFPGLSSTIDQLKQLKAEIAVVYKNDNYGEKFYLPLALTDDDIAFINCPVTRTSDNKAEAALKDVECFYEAGRLLVDSGLTLSPTQRKSPYKLNAVEAGKVKDSVNVYYQLAFNKFSNLVSDIYCTEQSNVVKTKINDLRLLRNEADSLQKYITRLKTLRNEVTADKITFLGMVADARQFANLNHTLQEYREEMMEPFNHAQQSQSEAMKLYPSHDDAIYAAMDYQSMVDTLDLFDKWMNHKIAEQGARECWEKSKTAWEEAVAYMTGERWKTDNEESRIAFLSDRKDVADTAWKEATTYSSASTYTTEAKRFRDAISDSIAAYPSLAAAALKNAETDAAIIVRQVKAKATEVEKAISLSESDTRHMATRATTSARTSALVIQKRDQLLEECYDLVNQALNIYYDASTDYRVIAAMKTDYSSDELNRLNNRAKTTVEAAKTVKKSLETLKSYGNEAQGYYDLANAKVLAQNNIWNVVITDCGTMTKSTLIKIISEAKGLELTEAKKIVEQGAPFTIYVQIAKTDAEVHVAELTRNGAVAKIQKNETKSGLPSLSSTSTTGSDVFDVLLSSCGSSKISVINVVRDATGMGLSDAKTLVDGPLPATIKKGMTKANADALVAKLRDAGGTATAVGRNTTVHAGPSVYHVVLHAHNGNTVNVIKAIRNFTGMGLSDATNLVKGTLPVTVKDGMTKAEAEEAAKSINDAGGTATVGGGDETKSNALAPSEDFDKALTEFGSKAKPQGEEAVFAYTLPDNWYKPANSIIHYASVPGVAEAIETEAGSIKADPKPRAKAKAKAEPEVPGAPVPSTPNVPGVSSPIAASIISNVTAGMNAKSGGSAKSTSTEAKAEPTSTPKPDGTAAQGSSSKGQNGGLVYDPAYETANTYIKDILFSDSKHGASTDDWWSGEITYYADATSVANSKLLALPVTYHCGTMNSEGVIEESSSRNASYNYHWLTIDGIDLSDYLTDDATQYRIVIEQIDKAKYAQFLEMQKDSITYSKDAELSKADGNEFLATAGGAEEANGNLDLNAFMANYYQEMSEEGLFTTSDTVSVNKISNKANLGTDQFVQKIFEWNFSTEFRENDVDIYPDFATYAQQNLVTKDGPNQHAIYYAKTEGLRPKEIVYQSGWSPREIAEKSDYDLFINKNYILSDPYVWLAFVGGYAFFTDKQINKGNSGFFEKDITTPQGYTFNLSSQSAAYRHTTKYESHFTNGGKRVGGDNPVYYKKAADLIQNIGVCYNTPSFSACLSDSLKRYHKWSSTGNDDGAIWTPANAMGEMLKIVSSTITYVREEYSQFQLKNDETRRNDLQTWLTGYLNPTNVDVRQLCGEYVYRNPHSTVTKEDLYTNADKPGGTGLMTSFPRYQPYLMSALNWYMCNKESWDDKKIIPTFEKYVKKDGDRYRFMPFMIAGGWDVDMTTLNNAIGADGSSEKFGKDSNRYTRLNQARDNWLFRFDSYCNHVEKIKYQIFRANCININNGQFGVDMGRQEGYVYEYIHEYPLEQYKTLNPGRATYYVDKSE